MFKMNLQLFAHKKGVGSTKNGRDSESKTTWREESRRTVRISWQHSLQTARNQDSSRSERRHAVEMIHYSLWLTALLKFERKGRDKKQVSVYPKTINE